MSIMSNYNNKQCIKVRIYIISRISIRVIFINFYNKIKKNIQRDWKTLARFTKEISL